mmetsp:Transcript_18056/g.42862  ORF Transcript_18056/g.42862 Transcript_18056/m.42862 type:complete len:227 (+) Transcript_18056:345-1025(+)
MQGEPAAAAKGKLRSIESWLCLIMPRPRRVAHLIRHAICGGKLPRRLVTSLRCRIFGVLLKGARANRLDGCFQPGSLWTPAERMGSHMPGHRNPWVCAKAGQEIVGTRARSQRGVAVHGVCRCLRPSCTLTDRLGLVLITFLLILPRLPVIEKVDLVQQKPPMTRAVQAFEQKNLITAGQAIRKDSMAKLWQAELARLVFVQDLESCTNAAKLCVCPTLEIQEHLA